jgi:CTP:phosphocholine cytidylyltransferase-like protein
MGNLHDDICTFMIIPCWILLGMRNFSDKFVEKIKTFCVQYLFFPEIMLLWDNVEKCYTDRQATDDSMIGTCALHGG